MCYLPPGPRCSHHAHQEMMKALAAVQEEHNPNRKIALQERYEELKKVFFSTPRGQNELRLDIALLTTESHTNSEVLPRLNDLKLYFQNGQILRKNQLAAYKVFIETRDSSVQETLNTTNKQTLATAVAFNDLLSSLETRDLPVEAHISSESIITLEAPNKPTQQLLCIHQKFQKTIDVAREVDGEYILTPPAASDEDEVTKVAHILNTYQTFSALPITVKRTLQQWVQSYFSTQNITLLANVDTRTEVTQYILPHELFQFYELGFKLKKKLGGTTAYRHGDSDELRKAIQATIFADSDIQHVKKGNMSRTFLFKAPVTDELHYGIFYFAPQRTTSGELFYEVKARHNSTQYNVVMTLKRYDKVLTKSRREPLLHLLDHNLVRD